MSGSHQPVAGIRIVGHPDVLYVNAADLQLRGDDKVVIEIADGSIPGRVVITPDELIGRQNTSVAALAGSLERRDGEIVLTLTVGLAGQTPRHIGAAVHGPPHRDDRSSIHDLYREYASVATRLGHQIETVDGTGVIVALDRERGVSVVELDTGETVEVDRTQ